MVICMYFPGFLGSPFSFWLLSTFSPITVPCERCRWRHSISSAFTLPWRISSRPAAPLSRRWLWSILANRWFSTYPGHGSWTLAAKSPNEWSQERNITRWPASTTRKRMPSTSMISPVNVWFSFKCSIDWLIDWLTSCNQYQSSIDWLIDLFQFIESKISVLFVLGSISVFLAQTASQDDVIKAAFEAELLAHRLSGRKGLSMHWIAHYVLRYLRCRSLTSSVFFRSFQLGPHARIAIWHGRTVRPVQKTGQSGRLEFRLPLFGCERVASDLEKFRLDGRWCDGDMIEKDSWCGENSICFYWRLKINFSLFSKTIQNFSSFFVQNFFLHSPKRLFFSGALLDQFKVLWEHKSGILSRLLLRGIQIGE